MFYAAVAGYGGRITGVDDGGTVDQGAAGGGDDGGEYRGFSDAGVE